MLNESCAKHLTPLLRSRDGRQLCVACEAASKNGEADVDLPPAPKQFLPEAAPSRPARVSSKEVKEMDVKARVWRAPPADGLWEVLVQGPDLKVNCTRLASRDKRRLRLLAESLAVKVRLGAAVGVDACLLREAASEICVKLADKVILPKFASGNTQIGEPTAGQICVVSEGASFSFPEEDCLLVPSARVTPESIAAIIWDHLDARAVPALMQVPALSEVSSAPWWLEISLVDGGGMGQETTIRRQLKRAK